jgi:hypothetical protein
MSNPCRRSLLRRGGDALVLFAPRCRLYRTLGPIRADRRTVTNCPNAGVRICRTGPRIGHCRLSCTSLRASRKQAERQQLQRLPQSPQSPSDNAGPQMNEHGSSSNVVDIERATAAPSAAALQRHQARGGRSIRSGLFPTSLCSRTRAVLCGYTGWLSANAASAGNALRQNKPQHEPESAAVLPSSWFVFALSAECR